VRPAGIGLASVGGGGQSVKRGARSTNSSEEMRASARTWISIELALLC
jgi:hypothetical protein